MKKTTNFLLSCLLLLLLFDTSAQSDRSLYIGAKGGGSISQFSQPGTVLSGQVGGFFRFKATPFLQLQADVLYSVLGGGRNNLDRDLTLLDDPVSSAVEGPITSLEYLDRQIYAQTVQLPISVRLSPSGLEGSMVRPHLILGGSYAHMLQVMERRDSYFQFDNDSRIILSDTRVDVTADYFNMNVALHGGVELDFFLENDQVFSLGFTYTQGITNLNEVQLGQPENIEGLRTRSFNINFSYSIF